jgi:CRP-like cAMP-binding protein
VTGRAREPSKRASPLERAASVVGAHLSLSRAEGETIAPYLRMIRAPAGATLFASGTECRDLVLLGSGLVRVFYVHGARDVNLRLLAAPSTVIALSSFIQRQPSEETVQALTDIEGVTFRIRDFTDAHPGETSERIRRVLAEQHYLSMERRLRTLQWKSARERYAYFVAHMEKPIVEGVSGVHIASYLGVRPESLSRVRRRP